MRAVLPLGLSLAIMAGGYVAWSSAGPPQPIVDAVPEAVAPPDGKFQVVTDHFQVEGGAHMPLEQFGRVAERALAFACDSMALDPERIGADRLPIYFCDSIAEITSVEHGLGTWNPSRENPWGHGFFYSRGPAVTLLYNPKRAPGGVPHEVTHWIVNHFTRRCPRIINEGLAQHIESELFRTMPELRDRYRDVMGRNFWSLRRFNRPHPRPDHARLFRLSGKQFEDTRLSAAGWALAKTLFLYEKSHPGTLKKLLEDYGAADRRADPWRVFAARYPAPSIERAWLDLLAIVSD